MDDGDTPWTLGIAEAAQRTRSGFLTAEGLATACLDRIEALDPQLNSFITVPRDAVLREAERLDRDRDEGKPCGALHGVPIALKDCIDTAGLRTTGGSPVFKSRVPAEDATLVARLRRAGAIIIGKNTLNELCMSDGQSSYYGRVRNPWALDRETGGSSSGSCAGVAASLVPGAIGTDTGGSIRNPAAWCGVVGLKPTNGLVSNRGTIPLTPSLDCCGPITRSVADAALLLDVIAGYDRLDITSVAHPAENYVQALTRPVGGLRVGLPIGLFDRLAPEFAAIVQAAIDTIRGLVGSVTDIALPSGGEAMSLMPFGETLAWHAPVLRANRYLYSAQDQATLDGLAGRTAEDYIRARWALDLARRTVDDDLRDVDLLVFPTVHTAAPKLVARTRPVRDAARGMDALYDAGLFNVLGLPVLSLPCGFDGEGLPVGLSISGPLFSEATIFALAHAYERMTPWHQRRPALTQGNVPPPIPLEE
jgi:aspartyl-tRNA(Asn)/glutamyl-tRNA(Gln) amidotransferase subunit A